MSLPTPQVKKEQPVYCTVGPELLGKSFMTFADLVSSLLSVLQDKFGDQLVHFVGFSFGGVTAAAICSEYQRKDLPFTITLLDPAPVHSLVRNTGALPFGMSALQRRAQSFDAQLGTDLQTAVNAGVTTNEWELDVEMLRLVGGDMGLASMMRATASVAETIRTYTQVSHICHCVERWRGVKLHTDSIEVLDESLVFIGPPGGGVSRE